MSKKDTPKGSGELQELMDQALEKLKEGKPLEGKEGALTPLIKRLIETSMSGEMDGHLKESRPNRRNGKGKKKVKTSYGQVDINTPRDRDGSFSPKLVKKRQTSLGLSLDSKIIKLYASGMSYRDINEHIEELYGMSLSPAQLTTITDKVWSDIEQWKNRPLEEIYPFVWLDAMFYKVKQDGQVKKMAVYMIIGMSMEGKPELLGIYQSETESARFWSMVLSDLQARGVKDILIACIDNLTGFKEAIAHVFPQTDIQLCIVHQVRNSTRFVPWKDEREVIKDMKQIYKAPSRDAAEQQLEKFRAKWEKKYPVMIKSWLQNWDNLSTFFNYPPVIRKIMYTTNRIEAFHRQVRKFSKSKGAFTSERALYKFLYLVTQKVTKKWKGKPRYWNEVLGVLAINYEQRLAKYLGLEPPVEMVEKSSTLPHSNKDDDNKKAD